MPSTLRIKLSEIIGNDPEDALSHTTCGARKEIDLPEDLENLVNFRVAWEEWDAAHDHLRKDAPDRPHVNSGGVVARAK